MALGLILSSSDFNILDAGIHGAASNWIGGEYGNAGLNSELSNPLTSTGDFNRTFKTPDLDAFAGYFISSSVDSSLYSGSISTSKAYSLRAWIRLIRVGGAGSDNTALLGGGLVLMTNSNTMTTNSNVYNCHLGGYTLQFSGQQQNELPTPVDPDWVGLSIGTNGVNGAEDAMFPPIACDGPSNGGFDGAYAPNTWYRIRFDMVPVGSAGVTLNAYTSSAGDVESGQETWVLVGTKFVDATDAIYMDPTLPQNAMGYYMWEDSTATTENGMLIDQFEILVEDL